jgi:hypothetical protein
MAPESDDAFSVQGGLSVGEADRILPRLEAENIRFEIDTNPATGSPRNFDSVPRVKLFIHVDDLPRWERIRDEFFPI